MIEGSDESASCTIGEFGKRKSLKDMVKYYKDSSHSTQPIEKFIVRLRVGKRCRRSVVVLHIIS